MSYQNYINIHYYWYISGIRGKWQTDFLPFTNKGLLPNY